MKRNIIIIIVVILIAGGITYKLAANKKVIEAKSQQESTRVIIPVNTVTTKLNQGQNNLVKSGTLIPFKEADITAVSAGKLTSVNFELGDHVSKGSVLATVDNSGLQLQLQAAKWQKEQAEKDYKRYKALLKGGATTKLNFQNAQLKYDNAKNQISQIKKQMADNRIKAPVSGQIVSKDKELGEYVGPGVVLGHVVDVNRLKVDVMVNERDVYTLEIGAAVSVKTDVYPGITFNGKIIFISQKGDAVHNYKVEVALQNKSHHHLRAGSFATVNFNRQSKEKELLIPKSALIESMDNPMVYVVDSQKAKIRHITIGKTYGNQIAVMDGLQPGEQIITTGLVNISEGTPVKIVASTDNKNG